MTSQLRTLNHCRRQRWIKHPKEIQKQFFEEDRRGSVPLLNSHFEATDSHREEEEEGGEGEGERKKAKQEHLGRLEIVILSKRFVRLCGF